jgi:hypothetical protein
MLAPLLSSASFFWPSLSCEFKIAGIYFSHCGYAIKSALQITTKRLASPPFRDFPPSTKYSTYSYTTFCILGPALLNAPFFKNTFPKAVYNSTLCKAAFNDISFLIEANVQIAVRLQDAASFQT